MCDGYAAERVDRREVSWHLNCASIDVTMSARMSVTVLSFAVFAGTGLGHAQMEPPGVLGALKAVVTLTTADIRALKAGQPVSILLDGDTAHEVAVFGAVWIEAPVTRYVDAIKDIAQFERGGRFEVTGRISDPPRLEDFAALDLSDPDVADLRRCRPGDCALQLDSRTIDRLQREIDWAKPTAVADAKAFFRCMAFENVTAYRRAGNEALAVYRDAQRPTFVAREFADMIDRIPVLLQSEPALHEYLLDYPNVKISNATSFLYWQQVRFGLKPTIRINHVVILQEADHVVVASKQLYSSHYFATALEVRMLIPDSSRGRGFWFVNVNRARSDGLSGFVGGLIRARVHGAALEGLTAGLQATKSALEVTALGGSRR
jgi:hypothetical protein